MVFEKMIIFFAYMYKPKIGYRARFSELAMMKTNLSTYIFFVIFELVKCKSII